MAETKIQNNRILSTWVIVCGLAYIFIYQFNLPFKADLFLYGMVIGLLAMILFNWKNTNAKQFKLYALVACFMFVAVAVSAYAGLSYTKMQITGAREVAQFAFFAILFVLSISNPVFIRTFTKWIYLVSILVILSSIVQYCIPDAFNDLMKKLFRSDVYDQLMWSYKIDNAYAGITAYVANTTFSAAVVFGTSFLAIVYKKESSIIKSKLLNLVLLALSVFCIIICSKRGIFVAVAVALVVLFIFLYRKKNIVLKLAGLAILASVAMVVLYNTNDFVYDFLNRFTGDDILTGREDIYKSLIVDFKNGNWLIGRGTAAAYFLAPSGAHNIYLQVLYDHGIVFSIPYYVFLIYNYCLAFKNKCPISIFMQTMFLVYGLSGNPLYSNMFMIIYIYYVLYAVVMPELKTLNNEEQENKKEAYN